MSHLNEQRLIRKSLVKWKKNISTIGRQRYRKKKKQWRIPTLASHTPPSPYLIQKSLCSVSTRCSSLLESRQNTAQIIKNLCSSSQSMLTSSRGCQAQQFHPLDIVMTQATTIMLTYVGINKHPCWWSMWASHVRALCEQSPLQPLGWRARARTQHLLCDRPSQLFCSRRILSPEDQEAILSSAQAVCSGVFCSLEGKPLLGRLSLQAAASFLSHAFSLSPS